MDIIRGSFHCIKYERAEGMNFVARVQDSSPQEGTVEIFWLGQAGFLIKSPSGRITAIDPYFSEYVMRLFPDMGLGFKRLMPPPCDADSIVFDVLLMSHEHADHFDVDSISAMMKNGRTQVYTNAPVAQKMLEMGFDEGRVHQLTKETPVELPDFTLIPVDCDHGAQTPDALGFILDFGFTKVYYAGDTRLSIDRLQTPVKAKPDVAILPINGAFGNLNGVQAAEYAGFLGCKVCIPCHFWTFPLHHGDPQEIIDAIGEKAPHCKLVLLCQGESYTASRESL